MKPRLNTENSLLEREVNDENKTERYHAPSIRTFLEGVKKFGDRKVIATPYVLPDGDSESFGLLLQSDHIEYDRKMPLVKEYRPSRRNFMKEKEGYLSIIKNVVYDIWEVDEVPVMVRTLQHLNRSPRKMSNDDFAYFFNLAFAAGNLKKNLNLEPKR